MTPAIAVLAIFCATPAESLQEYALVSQPPTRVECFRRNAEEQWVPYPFEAQDPMNLASLGFFCPVPAVYKNVDFTAATPQQSVL